MNKLLLSGALAASLAGCAATAPVTVEKPVEVKIPVPVTCLASAPAKPDFLTDGQILAGSDYQAVNLLRADRLARQGYEATLEAALTACR